MTLATAIDEQLYLTASGSAVFYAGHLAAGSAYEIHELFDGRDVSLGTVPALPRSQAPSGIMLVADATDVYVLGNADGSDVALWRVSRDPADDGDSPPVVTTAPATAAYGLTLGSGGVVAWDDDRGIEVATVPGPSTPIIASATASSIAFVGDVGYTLTQQIATSRSTWVTFEELTPMQNSTQSLATCASPLSFFGDLRARSRRASSPSTTRTCTPSRRAAHRSRCW